MSKTGVLFNSEINLSGIRELLLFSSDFLAAVRCGVVREYDAICLILRSTSMLRIF